MINSVNLINAAYENRFNPSAKRILKTDFRLCRDSFQLNTEKNSNISQKHKASTTVSFSGLFKRKVSIPIKNLSPDIKFEETKTPEQARNFAKDNFGIMLDVEDNLFTADLINDIFSQASNKMKGKIALPEKCIISNFFKGAAAYNPFNNTMSINPDSFCNIIIQGSDKKINLLSAYNDMMKSGEKSYSDCMNDINYSKGMQECINLMKHNIFHELGHCNHFAQNPDAVNKDGKIYRAELAKFLDMPKTKNACKNYFKDDYYRKSPAEFVAETFAEKMQGNQTPLEAEKIYRYYGGPSI